MPKRKLDWTCSYCSKILKDPIMLPCGDSICGEHLIKNEYKQKCDKCNQDFEAKDIQFKSNKTLKELIENQTYLSEEEMSLKKELEQSIRKLFQFHDEIKQNKTKPQLVASNHFEEIRSQIDQHRDKLKEVIDAIALKIKYETKFYENIYSKSLIESFASFNHSKSLENELNQMEETFRNPNLLIETIREMQLKQEKSLNCIQLKLNEMNLVKDNLKSITEFQPNLSLFNQEGTSLFGSFKLEGYTNMNSFKSEILKGELQLSELIKLCEFSSNDKWSLLYRGTRDGFRPRDFHSKCDGHSNTLTIIKAKESQFIFGGYTTVSWDSSNEWKSDANAFIFSLTNNDNKPLKMQADPNEHEYSICCDPKCGPSFGFDYDIYIANTTMYSYSNLGNTFKHPQYEKGTNEAQTFLAGSFYFQLDEIEVYENNKNKI
jgi:hypothetical protein